MKSISVSGGWKSPRFSLLLLVAAYSVGYSILLLTHALDDDIQSFLPNLAAGVSVLWEGSAAIFLPLRFDIFLVAMSSLVASAAIPLYLISSPRIGKWPSLALSFAYLLALPKWGIEGTGFNAVLAFPVFFFSGVYLYQKGRKWLPYVLVFLGGALWAPYLALSCVFCVSTLIKGWFWDERGKGPALVSLSLILAYLGAFAYDHTVVKGFAATPANYDVSRFGLNDPHVVIYTLFVVFAPLLFLPLLSWRWSLFVVPFVGLIALSSYSGYSGPWLFVSSHTILFLPFVFLGAVEALSRIRFDFRVLLVVLIADLMAGSTLFMLLAPTNGPLMSDYALYEKTASFLVGGRV